LAIPKTNIVWCRNKCYAEGYSYAGVQSTNECFCGNDFGRYGKAILEGNDWCTEECEDLGNRDDNAGNICGGSWANNIYTAQEAPVAYNHYGEGGGFFKHNSLSLIDEMGLAALASHGCWCGRLSGESDLEGSETVDSVDELCKEWFMKRRCLQVSGGACNAEGALRESEYFVANGRLESYDDVCEDAVETCAGSTCRVDEDMRRKINGTIVDLLEAGGDFPKQTTSCGLVGNPQPTPTCAGVAPNVEMLLIPCFNGVVTEGICVCDAGFQGEACDTEIPCVNGEINGYTCKCNSGWEGDACDQIDYPECGENRQYDPASGECEKCYRQTICPTNYLATQPSSCFGGPETTCISMCLLGENLGYLKLYEFEVNDGLFAVDGDNGSGVWYDRGGHLGNVPEEMWSTDQHPVYFSRFGNWWQRPVRFHIDGANNSGKVWIYRMFRTNESRYHDPIYADLLADGYTLVADAPTGQMYNANDGYGNFVAYKKLVDVNGILEITTQLQYWSGGVAFKLDCSGTA
jgi:hypothetical protein